MTKVIVVATPVHGHVMPLLAVAADLVRRGHDVVVHTGSRFGEHVRRIGARHVPLPAEADYDDRDYSASFPGRDDVPPGPPRMAWDLMHIFGDPVPAQYDGLRKLLAEFPAAVVIGDASFGGSAALALTHERTARPTVVGVGIMPVMFESVDAAPFGLALPPLAGDEGRARNQALNQQAREMLAPLHGYLAQVYAKVGVQLDDQLFNMVGTAPDHFVQLTVPGFEYPRSDLPASFRFVGALPPAPEPGMELPDWWSDLSGERPVVTVTQGTVDNADLTALVVPTLRALAELDVTVVAATARPDGPAAVLDALGELPANVRLGGYIPFGQLLPLSDVLITNGGYGGVQTALRHGVPLIVAGETEDKPEVAARVEWSGAGVNLRTGRPDEAAVRAAVELVLGTPRYRERALALQAEMETYDPFDAIAEIVEQA
ncbi:UDP:flavonoid glycosyltransferase YjiC, YdhE family [Nonomuraea maritima]|uniref:UDP:flavonoid glycosyltransferase YjiC, YdhE family n=1 Tax=Nonomuraea maritima TaxID=683260 RepID=A0A1G9M5V7_9ACTN|nr:nucleotide disphospho-sugar-binding domain-containing protein [Nonomuraea maritima]SDL69598.1 UDP:flavonoid glycosyltransferase YjiC, YdhE family [Nonomuraea maritima]